MVKIVEKSGLARIAAWVLRSKKMAITFGNRIYLHQARRSDLLHNERWLRHELKHVEQYQQLGFFGFIFRYLWYSIRYGYYQNPLEVEARLAEDDNQIVSRHPIAPTSHSV